MTRFTLEKRRTSLMVFNLVATTLIGCGGTNLTGYRPASEHAAAETTASSILPDTEIESDSQTDPLDAELTADDQPNEFELLPASALVPVNVVSSVRALLSIPGGDQKPAGISTAADIQTPDAVSESTESESAVIKASNQIEILIKDKKFQTESKTGALRVSFDDLDLLKVCNMEPVVENAVDFMPEWLKGLNGKHVRIRGFMYPTYETEGIERFVLARDNQICCFGRDPKVYDLVQIDMKPGKTTNYIPATRAFDVVGTLKIQMLAQDGKPYGLYLIDQAIVIDR